MDYGKDNMKISKSKFICISIQISYLLFFSIFYCSYNTNDTVVNNYVNYLFPWIIFLLIIDLCSFFLLKFSVFDFGMWFVIMSFFFMFGMIFTQKYNFSSTLLWNPIVYYTNNLIFKSVCFAIFCISMFFLGYITLFNDKKRKVNKKKYDTKNYSLFYIGIVLFMIGFASRIYTDVNIMRNTVLYNSYSAYSLSSSSGIIDDLAVFFIPGIAFIIFSNVIEPRKCNFLILFVLVYFFITMSLTGSRKTQIFSILDLLLIYLSYKKEKINKKRLITVIVISFLALNLMITIRDNRFNIISVIPIYFENIFSGKLFSSLVGEVLTETGITLYSITNIMKCVPDIFPYQYGMTFIKTLPSVLPIGWLIPNFFNSVSSTTCINKYLHIPVGSSLFGDFYWNFGFLGGIIVSFIFGILICIILRKIDLSTQQGKAIYFSLFCFFIMLVRAEFFDIFRSIVYICLLYFFIDKLINTIRN